MFTNLIKYLYKILRVGDEDLCNMYFNITTLKKKTKRKPVQ